MTSRTTGADAEKRGTQPPTVVCKMEAESEYVQHISCRFFARLAPICTLSRCLLTKFSASELRRKFIKSALLVGKAVFLSKRGLCKKKKKISQVETRKKANIAIFLESEIGMTICIYLQ